MKFNTDIGCWGVRPEDANEVTYCNYWLQNYMLVVTDQKSQMYCSFGKGVIFAIFFSFGF